MSSPNHAPMPDRPVPPIFSPGRIWTLAAATFTQLVRMRTFYFLLFFAVLVFGMSNVNLLYTAEQQLSTIRGTSFGAMWLFAWLFAVTATAVVIPRDIEDRTLYTILSKPVPRVEYLLGKFFGVLLVIAVALGAMLLLSGVVLEFRKAGLITESRIYLEQSPDITPADIQGQLDAISSEGFHPRLFTAAWIILLQAAVMAAATILVSTFASSSLFTIIVGIAFFLIGHGHRIAVDYWSEGGATNNWLAWAAKVVPDFHIFNVHEKIVAGSTAAPFVMAEITAYAGVYCVIYLLLGWYMFSDKEF